MMELFTFPSMIPKAGNMKLFRELKAAGFNVDANLVSSEQLN